MASCHLSKKKNDKKKLYARDQNKYKIKIYKITYEQKQKLIVLLGIVFVLR